jgi:hypothetical protein
MSFLIIQNQNITQGKRWITQIDPIGISPSYTARIHEFPREMAAREFAAECDGTLVAGKPIVLTFAGVADATKCPINIDFQEEMDAFMNAAASFLMTP